MMLWAGAVTFYIVDLFAVGNVGAAASSASSIQTDIKLSWHRKGCIFCANTELISHLPNNPPTVVSIRL